MRSTLASAAAQQTGLPVWVDEAEPGLGRSIRSWRPTMAEMGSELEMPLPQVVRSGRTP
ncbi:MAG: hypothetical protein QM757_24590 [Paludibaculum sp.]